jgi:cytochrome c-type biogenesis protein CcmH
MLIWIVLTVMIAMTCAALAVALVRRQEAAPKRLGDSEALRLQLAEIAAQAAAGTLPAETAETLRAETIRRFLAETPPAAEPARPLGRVALSIAAVGVAAVVALGAALIYAKLGRPALTTAVAEQTPAGVPASDPAVQLAGTIAGLEAKSRAAPRDVATLQALGDAYMQAGRFGDSAAAYGRAAALAPGDGELASAEGEALTKAADGQVTDPAKAAFQAALADDPANPRARYFLAAWEDQQGEHAAAMADWIALLKSAPPGAPWAPQVRAVVEQIAAQRHQDISAELPPEASPGPPDAAAIQALPPAQRTAMIAAMVDRLASRLKSQPHDPDGWVALMRARLVLSDPPGAAAAYHAALASDPADTPRLTAAAKQMGVPGA